MTNCYWIKLGFTVAIADLVFHEGKGLITRINVPPKYRGNGHGSDLLKRITADADAEGITLLVHPVASDGLSQRKIVAWYKRHGFKTTVGGIMERNAIQPSTSTES